MTTFSSIPFSLCCCRHISLYRLLCSMPPRLIRMKFRSKRRCRAFYSYHDEPRICRPESRVDRGVQPHPSGVRRALRAQRRADIRSSDLSDVASADPTVRKRLADEVRDACVNVGFFYGAPIICPICIFRADLSFVVVSNHGISETTIADALSATKAYFSLPLEQKMEVCRPPSSLSPKLPSPLASLRTRRPRTSWAITPSRAAATTRWAKETCTKASSLDGSHWRQADIQVAGKVLGPWWVRTFGLRNRRGSGRLSWRTSE